MDQHTMAMSSVLEALQQAISTPSLAAARELEQVLRESGCLSKTFGRVNQKSSIDAAAEGDRGITERIANAFDASLTAARRLAGIIDSDPTLRPRTAAQRLLNPKTDDCLWEPQHKNIQFDKPVVQFWSDDSVDCLRFRKYKSPEGFITALVQDSALGIPREKMATTILDLNSDDKLRTFEAIGQFGHGGSSALGFCELCLILTAPRFDARPNEFYWTLIFPDAEVGPSKQSVVRKWFASEDGLPLVGDQSFMQLDGVPFPGTSIWHFGYIRGNWLKTAAGTHQDTPAARLGRLFFSYPLPCQISGELARGDTRTGVRTVKGAYYRLLGDRVGKNANVEYRSGEKSEALVVDDVAYGSFSIFAFVLTESKLVRDYVDNKHPIIISLNGQNHGEATSKLLTDANLPELASSSIVEIRLDGLDEEALGNIITNSRERPKNSPFYRVLCERVREMLAEDESLRAIELRRQEEKAKQSSNELNQKLTRFLADVLSDATAEPTGSSGNNSPGPDRSHRPHPAPRPEIPACDPPRILEFVTSDLVVVHEATTRVIKFKSDARPPKYSFHGDNPRCFAEFHGSGERAVQIEFVGKSDVDGRGYGSVTLRCLEDTQSRIIEEEHVGQLEIKLQTTDGRTLSARIDVAVGIKPAEGNRKRRPSVRPRISFCAPDDADYECLAQLYGEDKIGPFGSHLDKYREALSVSEEECAYWGEPFESGGESQIIVEINVCYPMFLKAMKGAKTAAERIQLKERIVEDVVLDCYQHAFRLTDVPETVHEQVLAQNEQIARAAEICLNFDKSIRLAVRACKTE